MVEQSVFSLNKITHILNSLPPEEQALIIFALDKLAQREDEGNREVLLLPSELHMDYHSLLETVECLFERSIIGFPLDKEEYSHILFRWVDSLSIYEIEEKIKLNISSSLLDFLRENKEKINVVFNYPHLRDSTCSLYEELLCAWAQGRTVVNISFEELKDLSYFDQERYKRYEGLKNRWLIPAVQQINETQDAEFSVGLKEAEPKYTKGIKIQTINFYLQSKHN